MVSFQLLFLKHPCGSSVFHRQELHISRVTYSQSLYCEEYPGVAVPGILGADAVYIMCLLW